MLQTAAERLLERFCYPAFELDNELCARSHDARVVYMKDRSIYNYHIRSTFSRRQLFRVYFQRRLRTVSALHHRRQNVEMSGLLLRS